MNTWRRAAGFALALGLAGGCAFSPADTPPLAAAGIPPVAAWAQRLIGDGAVMTVLPPSANPRTFEITPRRLRDLSRASVLFIVGLPFERALAGRLRRAAPDLRVVNLADGLPLRRMRTAHEHHDDPAAAEDSEHAHTGADPHVWLDPNLARRMVAVMAEALAETQPDRREAVRRGAEALDRELVSLDEHLGRRLAPLRGSRLYVYHPAFGYFADAYGLEQVPVEIEGKAPMARDLKALARQARSDGVRVIFVQPQFSPHSARRLAASLDGAVVPLDPLAADYAANLRHMADTVFDALARPTPEP